MVSLAAADYDFKDMTQKITKYFYNLWEKVFFPQQKKLSL